MHPEYMLTSGLISRSPTRVPPSSLSDSDSEGKSQPAPLSLHTADLALITVITDEEMHVAGLMGCSLECISLKQVCPPNPGDSEIVAFFVQNDLAEVLQNFTAAGFRRLKDLRPSVQHLVNPQVMDSLDPKAAWSPKTRERIARALQSLVDDPADLIDGESAVADVFADETSGHGSGAGEEDESTGTTFPDPLVPQTMPTSPAPPDTLPRSPTLSTPPDTPPRAPTLSTPPIRSHAPPAASDEPSSQSISSSPITRTKRGGFG